MNPTWHRLANSRPLYMAGGVVILAAVVAWAALTNASGQEASSVLQWAFIPAGLLFARGVYLFYRQLKEEKGSAAGVRRSRFGWIYWLAVAVAAVAAVIKVARLY